MGKTRSAVPLFTPASSQTGDNALSARKSGGNINFALQECMQFVAAAKELTVTAGNLNEVPTLVMPNAGKHMNGAYCMVNTCVCISGMVDML